MLNGDGRIKNTVNITICIQMAYHWSSRVHSGRLRAILISKRIHPATLVECLCVFVCVCACDMGIADHKRLSMSCDSLCSKSYREIAQLLALSTSLAEWERYSKITTNHFARMYEPKTIDIRIIAHYDRNSLGVFILNEDINIK